MATAAGAVASWELLPDFWRVVAGVARAVSLLAAVCVGIAQDAFNAGTETPSEPRVAPLEAQAE